MAENLWRWHRRLAVVAISLLSPCGVFWASAQDAPGAAKQVPETPAAAADIDTPEPVKAAKTALRDLRVSALNQDDKIAVDWRFVSDGKSIKAAPQRSAPEIIVSGIKTKSTPPLPFADQGTDTVILVILSGRSAAELEYMRATSAAAVTALPGGAYRILIGVDGKDFKWAVDKQVNDAAAAAALFDPSVLKGAKPTRNKTSLTTGYAAALSALKTLSPRARAALIVPEPLLPQNQDLLTRLSAAAFTQRISFFPVAPDGGVNAARAQQMIDLAGPSAGRFLPDALEGRPLEERRAMFTEFQSGGSRVFTVNKKAFYSLPFEKTAPANVVINYGGLSDNFNLDITRRPLRGLPLAGAVINPLHWTSWLATPGRRLWGLGSILLWLMAIGGLFRLMVPPVKLYVQAVGENRIKKLRRLPVKFGRGTGQDIRLKHEGISREHAVIEMENGQLVIRDLGSTNGTFIAGERIKSAPLRPVQTVQMGSIKLILRTKR